MSSRSEQGFVALSYGCTASYRFELPRQFGGLRCSLEELSLQSRSEFLCAAHSGGVYAEVTFEPTKRQVEMCPDVPRLTKLI